MRGRLVIPAIHRLNFEIFRELTVKIFELVGVKQHYFGQL